MFFSQSFANFLQLFKIFSWISCSCSLYSFDGRFYYCVPFTVAFLEVSCFNNLFTFSSYILYCYFFFGFCSSVGASKLRLINMGLRSEYIFLFPMTVFFSSFSLFHLFSFPYLCWHLLYL